MLTNRINVTYNIENIDADFDIFRVEKANKDYYKYKLFYHDPSWRHKDKLTGKVNFIRFLEIVIDPGMYLNLEHKTFKRYDRESNGLYVIDSKTGGSRPSYIMLSSP